MHPRPGPLVRTFLMASVAVVVAACTGGGQLGQQPSRTPTSASPPPTSDGNGLTSPSPEDTGTASPTPASTDTAVADPAAQVPAIAETCTIEVTTGDADRVRLAYPQGWLVQDGCEWFDPDLESVEVGTEPAVAVSWRVSDVAFERAADVRDEIDDPVRYVGARSAYQAVRIEGEASGQGARERGEPVVMWLVDLDPGTDDQGGTLIGTADADGSAPPEVAAYALDRMADTILVEPAASDRFVVTRLDGGGMPTTVTWAADEGCFRLRAGGPDGDVVDEACDPGLPGSSRLAPVLLEAEGAQRMLAGIAASPIQRITVPAASTLSGGTTQSIEGGHLFALPVGVPPFEVTGHDYKGQTVTTVTFDR